MRHVTIVCVVFCRHYCALTQAAFEEMRTIGHGDVELLRIFIQGICRTEAWGAYVGAWVGRRALLFCTPLSCLFILFFYAFAVMRQSKIQSRRLCARLEDTADNNVFF